MSSEGQTGPLPYFDYHLKTLDESYIQYFQERARIEETYIESLRRLQLKQRALDAYRDERSDRGTSLRKAWRELGDNGDRELQTREAFLENLRAEVLSPLLALKETQERTRKRIKEDLKISTETHMEYAENTLPRLKRNYLKKCQDVEDYKSERTAAMNATADDSVLVKTLSGPQIGSPMPIRPLNRHASVHQPNRARSPSTSTAFSDLAHQGKKQLNSLIGVFNEGPKGSVLGKPEGAARGVRAKREADEAEKEYRKGVHWLETLRLRRIKTLESGCHSLETFVYETGETMKRALAKYVDSVIATSSTLLQLTTHVEPAIKSIMPADDTSLLTTRLRKMMISEVPKPVLYYNYMVGECRDLIFGVALVDYATSHNLPEGSVPRIVDLCVKEIEARGMDTEGIYRITGRVANVQELKVKVERDEKAFRFNPNVDDVACVASLLKLYLRELPEPVFRFPLTERLAHSTKREEHIMNNFPLVRSKLRRLSPVHQATLRVLLEHLARVSSRSKTNKMDPKNLSIVFGSVIFGEDELPKPENLLALSSKEDTLMEDLITHAGLLFDDKSQTAQVEPPLPPAPSGSPKPKVDYGSSYTKMHTLPPRTPEGQDFTPTLPPRPEQSIHPSRRGNVIPSQTPEPADPPVPLPPTTVPTALAPQRSEGAASAAPTAPTIVKEAMEDISHDFEVVEQEDVPADVPDRTSKVDPQSPKTPDSYTTAASSPSSSPRPDRTSRESSRRSLGRNISPPRP